METLVSVIIPVYNVFPYLREALDSVMNQTYQQLEILIIDDGSTDGSGAVCDEYAEKDPRIRVIHQENKGLSNARNVGLDMMTGDIVAMLDSDDAYERTMIEELKSAMEREQADLALGKYTVHYTTGKLKRKGTYTLWPSIPAGTYDRTGILLALADGRVNVMVWNKLYRRSLWKELRFLDGHVCEDHEATYRIIMESKKTVVIDSPLYLHRKRPGSITTTLTWKNLNDKIMMTSRVEKFVMENLSDVLPEESLVKIRHRYCNGMKIVYTRLFKIRERTDKRAEREKLKQQIIRNGQEIGTEGCWIRTKVAYHMICFCLLLLRIVFPACFFARALVYKLTGK